MKKLNLVITILCLLGSSWVSAQRPEIDIDVLIEELGIYESRVASRDMPGWERPKKIIYQRWVPDSGFGSADWFKEVADGVEIEFLQGSDNLERKLANTDVYFGGCNTAIMSSKNIDYIHILSAGVDACARIPGIQSAGLIVTNSQKAHSETIAEHAIALMLALTRNLHYYHSMQMKSEWSRGGPSDMPESISVKDKTLLVLGLGGIGSQAASRGYNLGMRVIGTRNSSREGPDYVEYVGLSDETNELAKQADVVINALPLTSTTQGIAGTEFFNNLKDGAYYITVGRGPTTDTDALVKALKSGKLNGAGLDVTDPEPLPSDHELWTMPKVIISQHTAGTSDLTSRNVLMIAKENLRRYIRGEKLLNMVDLARGY